ncbi:gamma carbonic anhydrase family protein [Thalassotalea nanhaiensis]|uniref:Gamma carbonic anhydrase family protein n=1 Tax=Thalassotalea nanhaiensis TaxID=3065648 RepID=A0ABY9TIJ8_9GAMM|nr:gamma carbonic anhydrase family protein [Colwelliaceae bacterium SQ345]
MTVSSLRPYRGIYPKLSEKVYVDPSSVLIGDITLGADVSIWPLVVARGDVNHITIGANSNIQDGSVLHVTRKTTKFPDGYPLVIGEEVTVGHKVMLHGCTLGDRILVGMGAIIMDGAVVGNDCIIGAGSLVPPNKTLEPGFLYVGNPAKQKRPLTDDELTFLRDTNANYVRLKDEYIAEQNQ